MVRLGWCLLVVTIAACPPRAQPPQPPQQPSLQAGCPAANGVYLASYVTQDANKGRSGWVMPLHAMKVDASAQVADYAPLDDAAATASGVPATPLGNLWLVTGNGAPCLIKLGGHYAAKIDGPPTSVSYGVELDGCGAPADPQEATGVVLVSQDTPSGCQFQTPQPIAGRMGEMTGPTSWTKPAKETPIPTDLAPLVPAHACTAPGCEQLWAFGQIEVDKKPVAWAGAVNWLTVGDPAKPCDWKAERWSGFFVLGPDGTPIKVTEGQDHPLALSAALVDKAGARVLLAEGPGEYAAYDLAPGKAVLGQHVLWEETSPEDWEAIDRLGPMCEAPAAAPAPLPKDAKPQSPYP